MVFHCFCCMTQVVRFRIPKNHRSHLKVETKDVERPNHRLNFLQSSGGKQRGKRGRAGEERAMVDARHCHFWMNCWIYPAPRMQVANRGLGWDSLLKNIIILMGPVAGWGLDPRCLLVSYAFA